MAKFEVTQWSVEDAYEYLSSLVAPEVGARRPIGNNTFLIREADGVKIRYHEAYILRYEVTPEGVVTLTIDTGGWFTPNTKDRINLFIPQCFFVIGSCRSGWTGEQRGSQPWEIMTLDDTGVTQYSIPFITFEDGMIVTTPDIPRRTP